MASTSVGGRLRQGLLAALCALAAGVPALADKKKSGNGSPPPRGFDLGAPLNLLYVWDASIPGDGRATEELLRFADRVRANTLAIEASPVGYGEPGALARYAEFTRAARHEGFLVIALGGYPWFTVAPDAGVPGQPTSWLEGWEIYGRIAKSGLFDAVLDDSSPAETNYVGADGELVNWFWQDPERASRDYLEYLAGLERVLGPLPHVQAVPLWFDNEPRLKQLYLEGETRAHSLAWYVARHVEAVNVLAYRDTARGILDSVAGELALGRVVIGVETMDLGPELAHATFFEEGARGLQLELNAVYQGLRRHPGLAGFSVHHYGSYRAMLLRDRPQGTH
ncbi:MAG: hypothetical protein ABL998_14100 [Planctomycetota bacterium]